MKKKQLRKENKKLRKRVAELEQEVLYLSNEINRLANSTIQIGLGYSLPYRWPIDWAPENSKPTTGDEYMRGVDKGWPPGYFEETAGCLADDPIKRWPQCNCD